MMKGKLTVAFGVVNAVGFDKLNVDCEDIEKAVFDITNREWVAVETEKGMKGINTKNILWFEAEVEKEE